MILRLLDTIASNPPRELKALIRLMHIAIQDEEYRQLVNKELVNFPTLRSERRCLKEAISLGPTACSWFLL